MQASKYFSSLAPVRNSSCFCFSPALLLNKFQDPGLHFVPDLPDPLQWLPLITPLIKRDVKKVLGLKQLQIDNDPHGSK